MGKLHDDMISSRAKFRAALNDCKGKEKLLRNEKMVNNLEGKNHKEFWRDVNWIKRHNIIYPGIIDGQSSPDSICEMFSSKY